MLKRIGETDLFKSISNEAFLEFYGKKEEVKMTNNGNMEEIRRSLAHNKPKMNYLEIAVLEHYVGHGGDILATAEFLKTTPEKVLHVVNGELKKQQAM